MSESLDVVLLPCPFCGSAPILHPISDHGFGDHQPVECPNKKCVMSHAWPGFDAWQSRPALAAPPDQSAPASEQDVREAFWFLPDYVIDAMIRDAKRRRSVPQSAERDAVDALDLAILFHHTYERLAPSKGYETRTETRVFDPETPNGKLMVAVCTELLGKLIIRLPPTASDPKKGE